MLRSQILLGLLPILALSAAAILAAAQASPSGDVGSLPRTRIVRTEEPIAIDGHLEEPSWEDAAVLREFAQVEPHPGEPGSESTEILLLYDRDYLYIGIRCFDREPEKILARQMVRDVSLTTDDRVSLVVDTHHDLQNGFLFSVNPLGARWDGSIEPGGAFREEWDGIWYAKARIGPEGWTAEMAIPFKTVSFNPAGTIWGFNVMRAIRRRNEIVRWASPNPNINFVNLAGAGIIEGMVEMEQGIGLDVKPQFGVTYHTDREKRDTDRLGQPSLDAFYRITPSMTASLTANTDFSDAPVDDRQVNLGRFPLFFPETRDFFLQDAGIFEFAGIEENGRPFFSRTIGRRQSGEPVDIRFGGKLTGRAGKFSVGVLDVQQASYEDIDSQNLGVARITYDIFDESYVGLIGTNGDPLSDDDNGVVGIDLRLRNSRLPGERVIALDAWALRSFSRGVNDGEASFGARLDYPNDRINFKLEHISLEKNYRPALGFVNRVGIRRYDGTFRYRIRPEGPILAVDAGFQGFVITDLGGDIETAEISVDFLRVESEIGDAVTFTYRRTRDDVEQDFEISDGVVIPPKTYAWDRIGLNVLTTPSRPVSIDFTLSWGEFFSGTRFETLFTVEWRPSRYFFAGLDYEQNDVRLDEGNFTTRLARLRLNLAFTPDISWESIAQYDNVSDSFGIQSRFRWIVDPGDEILLVLEQGFRADANTLRPLRTDLTFRISYTLRF
jgi:hypothetical protein